MTLTGLFLCVMAGISPIAEAHEVNPTPLKLALATGAGTLIGGYATLSMSYVAVAQSGIGSEGMGFEAIIIPGVGFVGGSIAGGIAMNRLSGGSRGWSLAATTLGTTVGGAVLLIASRSNAGAYVGAGTLALGPAISSGLLGYTDSAGREQTLTLVPIMTNDTNGVSIAGRF